MTRRQKIYAVVAGWIVASLLFRAIRGESHQRDPPFPSVVMSATPEPRPERVVETVPLELGEGDSRRESYVVWPADGSVESSLQSGTRIERLEETDRTRPATVPKCELSAGCVARIRITSGPKAGLVAYARTSIVQAAR